MELRVWPIIREQGAEWNATGNIGSAFSGGEEDYMRVLRFAGAFAPNIWMLGGQALP